MLEANDHPLSKVDSKRSTSTAGTNNPADSISIEAHGNLKWPTVGMIEIGEIVGVGVLTMGMAYAELGYALASVLVFIMGPVSIYMGMLLSHSYQTFPHSRSYGDMADKAFPLETLKIFLKTITLIYFLFLAASYFLALTQTIAIVFWGVEFCDVIWGAIIFAILIGPVQMRTLTSARWIFWVNFACVIIAIFLVLGYLYANVKTSEDRHTATAGPPEDITWISFFGALSKITFSYVGCFVYLEMMYEMEDSTQFNKSFLISGPVQIGLYLLVGLSAYSFSGTNASDSIVKEVDPSTDGGLLSTAAVFLCLHLVESYFIMSYGFHNNVHMIISPSTHTDKGWRGRLVWFCITLFTLCFAYVISNGVTFFDSLVSLLGSLFAPILGFHAPCYFYYLSCKQRGVKIPLWEKILLWMFVVYATILLTVGTAANIISLMDDFTSTGTVPFQCNFKSYQQSF